MAVCMRMKKAWSGLWREGVGFQKMPVQLEQALASIDPGLPAQVYGAVRGAMSWVMCSGVS